MSTCWKCGIDLPEPQTECEDGCGSSAARNTWVPSSDASGIEALLESLKNRVKIDWSKVKTADDLILVISIIFHEASLPRNSREAHFLKRYLQDNPGAEPQNPA